MPDIARLERNYHEMRALHLNAAIGRLPCPDCGAADGMVEWDAEAVWAIESSDTGVVEQGPWLFVGAPKFYRHPSRNDVLYATCWQCREHERPADGYTEMTPKQIERWLNAQHSEGGNNG